MIIPSNLCHRRFLLSSVRQLSNALAETAAARRRHCVRYRVWANEPCVVCEAGSLVDGIPRARALPTHTACRLRLRWLGRGWRRLPGEVQRPTERQPTRTRPRMSLGVLHLRPHRSRRLSRPPRRPRSRVLVSRPQWGYELVYGGHPYPAPEECTTAAPTPDSRHGSSKTAASSERERLPALCRAKC